MLVTRDQVVITARSLLGARYAHQGRSLAEGFDCAGPVVYVAHYWGLTDFDTTDYTYYPDGETMRRLLDEHLVRTYWTRARRGDVAVFAGSKWECHLGILTDLYQPFGLIHSWLVAQKVVEHRLDDDWKAKVRGVYRFPHLILDPDEDLCNS